MKGARAKREMRNSTGIPRFKDPAAEECREGVESQTCEQYNSGTVPAACSRVCAAN